MCTLSACQAYLYAAITAQSVSTAAAPAPALRLACLAGLVFGGILVQIAMPQTAQTLHSGTFNSPEPLRTDPIP